MDITIEIDLGQAARECGLPLESVQNTVMLLDDGNTVPFITRFRKDLTGALDEEQVRRIQEKVGKLRALADRKQTILKSIQSQGIMTPELLDQIRTATSSKRLEDLYLPYKPKKQTLATTARQRGLEPLAREVLDADPAAADLQARAADLVAPANEIHNVEDVLAGVRHIIAEWFSERAEVRGRLRKVLQRTAKLLCSRIDPAARRETPESTGSDSTEESATDVAHVDSLASESEPVQADDPAARQSTPPEMISPPAEELTAKIESLPAEQAAGPEPALPEFHLQETTDQPLETAAVEPWPAAIAGHEIPTAASDIATAPPGGSTTAAAEFAVPELAAPESSARESTAPESTAPESTAPELAAPELAAPESTAP
ncbi:MAG: Tex-like N-terminal domain-containing protein, partial [Pirellulaceae bacterium]